MAVVHGTRALVAGTYVRPTMRHMAQKFLVTLYHLWLKVQYDMRDGI